MPISRCRLHKNKVEEFKSFLVNRGWTIQELKGDCDALRATHKNFNTIVLYQRDRTDHLTIGKNMSHANRLLSDYFRARRNKKNEDN